MPTDNRIIEYTYTNLHSGANMISVPLWLNAVDELTTDNSVANFGQNFMIGDKQCIGGLIGEGVAANWTGPVLGFVGSFTHIYPGQGFWLVLLNDDECINQFYGDTVEGASATITGTRSMHNSDGEQIPYDLNNQLYVSMAEVIDYYPNLVESDDAVYGCTNQQACNYNPGATLDDNSCTYPTGVCDCDGNIESWASWACDCNGNPPLPYRDCDGSCIYDFDGDGVCDQEDDCVGEVLECGCNTPMPDGACNCNGDVEDECGICGGNGIPDGACDCDGNTLDCNGDCGGSSVLDLCGECNGDNSCVGCMETEAINYDSEATVPCNDCCEFDLQTFVDFPADFLKGFGDSYTPLYRQYIAFTLPPKCGIRYGLGECTSADLVCAGSKTPSLASCSGLAEFASCEGDGTCAQYDIDSTLKASVFSNNPDTTGGIEADPSLFDLGVPGAPKIDTIYTNQYDDDGSGGSSRGFIQYISANYYGTFPESDGWFDLNRDLQYFEPGKGYYIEVKNDMYIKWIDPNLSCEEMGLITCTSTGVCQETIESCPCVDQGLIECWDGTCVESIEDCPCDEGLIECTSTGECVETIESCPCVDQGFEECWDGTCVESIEDCPCDEGLIECWDGSCAEDELACYDSGICEEDEVEILGTCYGLNTTSLDLSHQELYVIPPPIQLLTYLTDLRLDHCKISGEIPSWIGNLINLEWLQLDHNQLTGEIPSEIGNLTNLTHLYLRSNQLTGEIPSWIGNLTNLTYLMLDNNQLGCYEYDYECDPSGEASNCCITHCDETDECYFGIPREIGNLTNLVILSLYNNQLTGGIPSEIGNLTNLVQLYLDYNQFTGLITEEICNQGDSNPSLNNNNLCPPYPECIEDYVGYQDTSNCEESSLCDEETEVELWGECYNIDETTSLNLGGSGLTGEIPPEIGNLTNLTYLDLNHNQLTGEIPPEIGNLMNLNELWLVGNQLTGVIPEEICNQGDSTPSVGNNQLCPPYPSCISQSNIDSQDTSECVDDIGVELIECGDFNCCSGCNSLEENLMLIDLGWEFENQYQWSNSYFPDISGNALRMKGDGNDAAKVWKRVSVFPGCEYEFNYSGIYAGGINMGRSISLSNEPLENLSCQSADCAQDEDRFIGQHYDSNNDEHLYTDKFNDGSLYFMYGWNYYHPDQGYNHWPDVGQMPVIFTPTSSDLYINFYQHWTFANQTDKVGYFSLINTGNCV